MVVGITLQFRNRYSSQLPDAMDDWSMEEVQSFCKTFAGLVMDDGDIHPATQLEKILHSLCRNPWNTNAGPGLL